MVTTFSQEGADTYGVMIGMPSLKLNDVGKVSKHCGSFKKVAKEALKERKGRDTDIDKSKADDNITEGFQTAAELLAYSEQHIVELNAEIDKRNKALEEINLQRKEQGLKPLPKEKHIRQDAVKMCATIIKPPAVWIETLEREQQEKFFRDCIDKLSELVGADNIKSIAIHFDEQGAHMHLFWEPMTEDGRLCGKDVHNIKFFGKLNREMPKFLREHGWEIDDCNAYDAAAEQELKAKLGKDGYRKHLAEKSAKNGRSSFKYKTEAENKKRELEQEVEDYIKSVTVTTEKTTKTFFGKEKKADKSPEEIEADKMVLLAQAVLRDKDTIDRERKNLDKDKKHYESLIADEEALIEAKAERIAGHKISSRELDAIKRAKAAEDKLTDLNEAFRIKTGMSAEEFISENTTGDRNAVDKKSERSFDYSER